MGWLEIDRKVKEFEDTLEIPDLTLSTVSRVKLKSEADLLQIPKEGGCYWIWTNAEIKHGFHSGSIPERVNNGEIIYNGIAKDNIRGRIQKHLFGKVDEGMSAISIDLLLEDYKGSHRKKALATTGHTAFFEKKRIRDKADLLKLHLSDLEKEFLETSEHSICFRNGINITENKHLKYEFEVFFLSGFKSASFGDIIEKKWREKYGVPKLCTYSKGR